MGSYRVLNNTMNDLCRFVLEPSLDMIRTDKVTEHISFARPISLELLYRDKLGSGFCLKHRLPSTFLKESEENEYVITNDFLLFSSMFL